MTKNRPAVAALVLGIASLPAALTAVGGMVLGLAAIVTGFFGVARAGHLAGTGQGAAVTGVVTGMLGMGLGGALGLFLA